LKILISVLKRLPTDILFTKQKQNLASKPGLIIKAASFSKSFTDGIAAIFSKWFKGITRQNLKCSTRNKQAGGEGLKWHPAADILSHLV
jgi:hypothetical protein